MRCAVVMGSASDFPLVKPCVETLKKFGIDPLVSVISAHRTPDKAADFAKNAEGEGIDVIIAAAGKAAHLAGAMAANSALPVIGIPVKSTALDGLDALLSTVQMPPGVPVATVGIDAAKNAAILAVQIMALKYPVLSDRIKKYKIEMAVEAEKMDAAVKEEVLGL
ncbi:MAG: 5-(carboxyamino)imidazole ribonucleotide mutase [Christensenellales bacterium]